MSSLSGESEATLTVRISKYLNDVLFNQLVNGLYQILKHKRLTIEDLYDVTDTAVRKYMHSDTGLRGTKIDMVIIDECINFSSTLPEKS